MAHLTAQSSGASITDEQAKTSSGKTPASSSALSSPKPKDAFTALMAPKRKASSPSSPPISKRSSSSKHLSLLGRDGLAPYIAQPEKYSAAQVLAYNDAFVSIHDAYPKSSVHCLLLPRSASKTLLHPFDAFIDASFLAAVRKEAAVLKIAVASELRRKYGHVSQGDAMREKVLNGEVLWDSDDLPPGRDWEAEVRVGVHAHPSMTHLHIHVISVDRHSECLKHRKHYNSFATGFFVALEDFPLGEEDKRWHAGSMLKEDLKCWRCGMNFGNKFAKLKEHLEEEFQVWRKE